MIQVPVKGERFAVVSFRLACAVAVAAQGTHAFKGSWVQFVIYGFMLALIAYQAHMLLATLRHQEDTRVERDYREALSAIALREYETRQAEEAEWRARMRQDAADREREKAEAERKRKEAVLARDLERAKTDPRVLAPALGGDRAQEEA